MNRFLTSSFCIAIVVLLLSSCGGKDAEELKQAMDVLKDLPQKAENMQKDMDQAEARQKERRSKGDTLAIPYKKLQSFLPASIPGYEKPELSGESTNMGAFSMSQARGRYMRTAADGSTEEIEISIVDYNENYGLYAGMAFFLQGYSREDDNGWEKTYDTGVKYAWALEKFDKNSKRAELSIAAAWRFWINITADNQKDCENLKSIAKNIDLNTLSSM